MVEDTVHQPVKSELLLTTIAPSRGWIPLNLGELWQFRELVFLLAWRDVAIRYKQTILGIAWAILQPFFSMVIFSIFFGSFAHIPSDGLPYPIFSFAALLPWQYFSTAMNEASQSLINNERLLTKIYFPRLIIPVASVLPAVLDFAIGFVILIVLMLLYNIHFAAAIVWLPVFFLIAFAASLGVGLFIAALNVQYRDFRYIVPFLLQSWMFLSPVAYSLSIVPEQLHLLYSLNPLVGVIQGFRDVLLGTHTLTIPDAFVSAFTALIFLIVGAIYFRRVEDSFADVV